MIPVLVEAALRALLVALTVWAGLRLFRVGNVLAQKAAWGLVLAASVTMPLVMRWQILPPWMAFNVPVTRWHAATGQLPVGNAVLLSTHAEGAVDAPEARLAATTSPGTDWSVEERFPAPTISAKEFSRKRTKTVPSHLISSRTVQVQLPPAAEAGNDAGRTAAAGIPALGTLAVFVYFAVCAVLLLRTIFGLGMAMRLWMNSEPFQPEPGPDPERDPGAGMSVRFSFAVSSPVTIGSGVLLPADCLGWDREKLRIVLAHERAHVRQGDFYLQLLAGLYAAMFWFSPLGWWLKRELSDLSEAISDRAGLEEAASSTSYAQVLLEFAALPRPTVLGVAMARHTNLSHRIERFLNETSFRQAFAGSRRRTLAAVLLVPVALFAGTALIRVEAAANGQSVQTPPPPAVPNAAPAAAPSTPVEAAAPAPAPVAPVAPAAAPVPSFGEIHDAADDRVVTMTNSQDASTTNTIASSDGRHVSTSVGKGYSYSYSSDGDSWALVTDSTKHVMFNGDWNDDAKRDLDKVRKLTNGKFLWFERDGKAYFLDDQSIVGQIQEMYRPMDELGRRQEELGKKQEELGRQQEALGRKQEEASIPTPDMSKELAQLNEAVAKLNAKKGGTVSQEDLADLQGKIGDLQGRLGELQGEMGSRQGELGAQQGELGEKQGRLGEEQGRLGAEQGRIAQEVDRKVRSIINESLRNGKARPVE